MFTYQIETSWMCINQLLIVTEIWKTDHIVTCAINTVARISMFKHLQF